MAVRRSIRFEELPDLPAVPHQPSGFLFPKRPFGKTKVVYRSFQGSWLRNGHSFTTMKQRMLHIAIPV